MNNLSTSMAVIIAAVIIAGGLYFGLKGSENNQNTSTAKELTTRDISRAIKVTVNNEKDLETKVSADETIVGNFESAEVFVIKYADYECPACKNYNDSIGEMASEVFKNDDRVAFVYRDFPLSKPFIGYDKFPTSTEQAVIMECVAMLGGGDKYAEAMKEIYAETASNGRYDLPFLLTQIEEIGIKKTDLKKCYSGTEAPARVAKQFQQGVIMGVQGTPTIFIQTKDGEVSLLDRTKPFDEVINSYLK